MITTEVKRNTFSILFFMHRSKSNKKGEHPIYCRLTVQGRSREFSCQLWIKNEKWIPVAAGKIAGYLIYKELSDEPGFPGFFIDF